MHKIQKYFFSFIVILSLNLSHATAAPQNSNQICTGPSFDTESVDFNECPNGFTFATFNRYNNVNFLGAQANIPSNHESESEFILSARKYIAPTQESRNNINYNDFNDTTDPAHSRFIPYASLGELNPETNDIIEFNIYLHNNGNPECNFDATKCNNRHTYADNFFLRFLNDFDSSTKQFKNFSLDTQYNRPGINNQNSVIKTFNRANIAGLLNTNQKLKLLSTEDIQNSDDRHASNNAKVLHNGYEILACPEFIENSNGQFIDCKPGSLNAIRANQDELAHLLKDGLKINRTGGNLDRETFLASTGYAIHLTFFAKVIEEPPVCEGDIDMELDLIEGVTPFFILKEPRNDNNIIGEAQFIVNPPPGFTPEKFGTDNNDIVSLTTRQDRKQKLNFKWTNFNNTVRLGVPETQCSTVLKLPKCKGLELADQNINLKTGTAQLNYTQTIGFDGPNNPDPLLHYGTNRPNARENLAKAFNKGLRFTHKNKNGIIQSEFQGTSKRDNNSLESTYNVIIVPEDTDFDEDFEIQDEDTIGEKVVKVLFKALTAEGEDQAFFWKTDLEACDVIEASCLHFEEDCFTSTQIQPPNCNTTSIKKPLNLNRPDIIELKFTPNLKIYHEQLELTQTGDFSFQKNTSPGPDPKTTITLTNFDGDDQLEYYVPDAIKICSSPADPLDFFRTYGGVIENIVNSTNPYPDRWGRDIIRMKRNIGTLDLKPNLSAELRPGVQRAIDATINPRLEIDRSALDLSKDLEPVNPNLQIENSPGSCDGTIRPEEKTECAISIITKGFDRNTKQIFIVYTLDPSFVDKLSITTNQDGITKDKIKPRASGTREPNQFIALIELDEFLNTEPNLPANIVITLKVEGEKDCKAILTIALPSEEEKVCSLTDFSLNEEENIISYDLENEEEFENNLVVEYAGAFRLDKISNKIFLDEVIPGATIKLFVADQEGCEAEITLPEKPEENVSCENLEIKSPNPSEEFDFRDIASVRFATQPRNFNDVFNLTITREDGSKIFGESSSKRLSRDFLQALNENQALDPNAKLEIVSQRFPRSCRAEIQGTFETPNCKNLILTDLDGSEITEIPRAGSSFIKFQTTSSDGSDFSFPITFRPASSEAVVQSVGSDRLESQNIALITPNGEDDFQFFAEGFAEDCIVNLTTDPNIKNETLEIATRITKAASKTVITQNDFVDYQLNFQVRISSIPDSIEGDFISYTLKDTIFSDKDININYNSATINGVPFNAQDLDTGLTIEVPAERGIHNFNINYRVNFNFADLNRYCENDSNESCGLDIFNTAQILETGDAATAAVRMLCPYLVTRSFGDILFNKKVNLNTIDLSKCTALPNTQSPIFQQEEQKQAVVRTGDAGTQAPTRRICREEGDIENISSGVCETISINGPSNELNLEKVRKTLNFQLSKFKNIKNLGTEVELNDLEGARDKNLTDEKNVFHRSGTLNIRGSYNGTQAILILAEGDITITSNITASNAPIAIVSLNGNILIDRNVDSIQASLITVKDEKQLKIKQGTKDGALEIQGTIISNINKLYEQIEFVGDISQNQGRLTIIYDGRVQFMPPPGLSDPLIFNMQSQ